MSLFKFYNLHKFDRSFTQLTIELVFAKLDWLFKSEKSTRLLICPLIILDIRKTSWDWIRCCFSRVRQQLKRLTTALSQFKLSRKNISPQPHFSLQAIATWPDRRLKIQNATEPWIHQRSWLGRVSKTLDRTSGQSASPEILQNVLWSKLIILLRSSTL